MFEYLEKLRQKSPATRKLIAFTLSFLVAGIIFLFWILVTMPSIWSDKSIADRVSADQPSPISSLSQIFSQGSSVLNEQLNKLKNLGQNEGNLTTTCCWLSHASTAPPLIFIPPASHTCQGMADGGAEGAAGAAASGGVGSRGLLTGGGFGGQNSPVVTVHGLYSEVQVRPYLGPVENPHLAPYLAPYLDPYLAPYIV